MIPPSIKDRINGYKLQLAELLAPVYVEHSTLLGFTSVVQGNFQKWIYEDAETFHDLFVQAPPDKQIDTSLCNSIELLQTIWADFQYPIIKRYQLMHESLCNEMIQMLKGNNKKKFKSVEMRKLSDNFKKYDNTVRAFYSKLLHDLGSKYYNSLIPSTYLQDFDIVIPSAKEEERLVDFHATLTYILFHCLLAMGNSSRHYAKSLVSYVQPYKSMSTYYKHVRDPEFFASNGKSLFIYSLRCYSKCLGMLPTMQEPYNHIGMVYNSLGQKFSAALWFLRSQFTRDTNIAVGRHNLHNIFKKSWLRTAYKQVCHKAQPLELSDINVILLRIIADYFYFILYKDRLKIQNVEAHFFNTLFSQSGNTISKSPNYVTEHLTCLICFYQLGESEHDATLRNRFGSFVARYMNSYLAYIVNQEITTLNEGEMALKNARLILAFLRKNTVFSKQHGSQLIPNIAKALNVFTNCDDNVATSVREAFSENKVPVRNHYFSEDVHFKDFTPIGCQFKDFDDTHLFKNGSMHLLFGSHFCTKKHEIPEFLNNEAVRRINKFIESKGVNEISLDDVIASELSLYENTLRLHACVVTVRSLFGEKVILNEEKGVFELRKSKLAKSQEKTHTKQKISENVSKDQEVEYPEVQDSQQAIPSSLEEIESMILGHASMISKKSPDEEGNLGLAKMVYSIVQDDEVVHAKNEETINESEEESRGSLRTSDSTHVQSPHMSSGSDVSYGIAAPSGSKNLLQRMISSPVYNVSEQEPLKATLSAQTQMDRSSSSPQQLQVPSVWPYVNQAWFAGQPQQAQQLQGQGPVQPPVEYPMQIAPEPTAFGFPPPGPNMFYPGFPYQPQRYAAVNAPLPPTSQNGFGPMYPMFMPPSHYMPSLPPGPSYAHNNADGSQMASPSPRVQRNNQSQGQIYAP